MPSGVLYEDRQLGPFPLQRLKRVDRPTNLITGDVKRIDGRETAFLRAARGDYGEAVKRESSRRSRKYPLYTAQREVMYHLNTIKCNDVAPARAPIPEDPKVLSRHIKRLGYFLKADIMGICRLPESAVYSHDNQGNPIDIDYPWAIVIVMSKERQTLNASNGNDWMGSPLSFQAYQPLGIAAHTIANYIRKLGYQASAQTAGQYQVLMPPLLLWAGIGEVSRAGIILNPFLGLGFKASAVLTDMPLAADKPIDFGLQDFCRQCQLCAQMCPSNAIPMGDKTMYNGYETWKLDERRCASFSMLNKHGTMCGKCVHVCPWNRPYAWQHNLVRWGIERSSLARSLAIRADRALGRGKEGGNDDEKWWFDLEDVDGVITIAH